MALSGPSGNNMGNNFHSGYSEIYSKPRQVITSDPEIGYRLKESSTSLTFGQKFSIDNFLPPIGPQYLNGPINKVKIDALGNIRELIAFREKFFGEISEFLENNKHLLPSIDTAVQILEEIFPGQKLIAELSSDPESKVRSDKIVIYIKASLSVEETLKRLEEFDHRYGNYLYLISGKKILIMEEFE